MHQQEEDDEANLQASQQPIMQEEVKTSNTKTYLILILVILFNSIMGYQFIKKALQQQSSECYYLSQSSFYYGEVLVCIAIFSLFIIIPCTCRPCFSSEYSANLYRVIMSFECTQQLFFLIALSIAFSYHEQCGKLNKFVFVYLAFNLSILFFGVSIFVWIIIRTNDISLFDTLQVSG